MYRLISASRKAAAKTAAQTTDMSIDQFIAEQMRDSPLMLGPEDFGLDDIDLVLVYLIDSGIAEAALDGDSDALLTAQDLTENNDGP